MTQSEPRVGCGAAIIRDGHILLLQRLRPPQAGFWGLPGGKIDLFETAEAAICREVREEVGVEIKIERLLCFVNEIYQADGIHWASPTFLVTEFSGDPYNVEPEKHGGVEWVPLTDMPEKLTTPTIFALEALRKILPS